MSVKVHHAALSVPDLAAACRQWTALTGFAATGPRTFSAAEADAVGLGPVTVTAQHLLGHTGVLELVQVDGGATEPEPAVTSVAEPGITHACVQAPADGDRLDLLLRAGGRPLSAPVLLPTGIHYSYVRDDGGNVLELEQLSPSYLAEAPADTGTWLGHVGLCTPDAERATRFWAGVLEQEPYARAEFGPAPAFDEITGLSGARMSWSSWLRTGVLGLELWQFHEPRTQPRPGPRGVDALGWHHVGLACTDVRAERDRLLALGASFPEPPSGDAPLAVLFGRDPDGTLIELLDPSATTPASTPATTPATTTLGVPA